MNGKKVSFSHLSAVIELDNMKVEVILLRAPFQILAIPYRVRLTWDSNKTALYELSLA